ncbi:MAG: CHRD domain-containing protein [Bryobacteraceae bacterium]
MNRAIVCLFCGAVLLAQTQQQFRTRLAPVAINAAMQLIIAGRGSATATLDGNKLSIHGTFEGLRSRATEAHLRLSPVTGVPGRAVFELKVTKALSGTVEGSFDLTPAQVEALKKGKFYIQIASEKAPGGNLWGWLLR